MTRMEQAKRHLALRISHQGYDHIKARAERADVDVSHMARRMFAFAAIHMPEGWVPPPSPHSGGQQ